MLKADIIRLSFLLTISMFVIVACKTKSKYQKAADEIVANTPAPNNMGISKLGYHLAIPKGWTAEYRENYGLKYYYLLAPKTEEDPNTNINVGNEFMQHLSLDEYKEKAKTAIKKAIPSSNILEEGFIMANGLKGNWFSYTMTPQGINASLICYIFPKDGIAYLITAGTQTKDALLYRNTFDSVARSFKLVE